MQRRILTSLQERRTGVDRRSGLEWRSGADRRAALRPAGENAAQPGVSEIVLRDLLPYSPFGERDDADRSAAIAAHRSELNARVGRDVGAAVAALDYQLNIQHELAAPVIVERGVLEVLERRSVMDPLTGLFNRSYLDAALNQEIAQAQRYGSPLSLLLVAVDGVEGADRAAGRAVGAIQHGLRRSDVAARYAGEELAIILPDTGAAAARVVAGRLCAKLGGGARAGLTAFPPEAPSTSAAQLLVAVCRALVVAKSRGDGDGVAEERP